MNRLVILSLLTFSFLISFSCSNKKSRELLSYKGFQYKTVAITVGAYQNHTIYIEGFDPKKREDIIDLAGLLVCYSKSSYLKESSKFYDFQSGIRLDKRNIPIGSIFIVSKWTDDFNYLSSKKRIASMNFAQTDKIQLKFYSNSFPREKEIYSISDFGIDYNNLVCN